MKPADRLIVCLVAMVLGAPAGAALARLLWPGQEALAGGLAAFVLTIATVLAVVRPHGGLTPKTAALVPPGKSAEDLVRHLAFIVFVREFTGWHAAEVLPKAARAFGIDAKKIVDRYGQSPDGKWQRMGDLQTSAVAEKPGHKAAPKKRAAKAKRPKKAKS